MNAPVVVTLTHLKDYQFENTFSPDLPTWLTDEPEPLGCGLGPSPVQLLSSAVGNCLSASLLFAFRKFKLEATFLQCRVHAQVGRNASAKLRVLSLEVEIEIHPQAVDSSQLSRILEQFEGFCTVTQSVRSSIPVHLVVKDSQSMVLHESH